MDNVCNGVSVGGLWSTSPIDYYAFQFLKSLEPGEHTTVCGNINDVTAWTMGAQVFVQRLRKAVQTVIARPPPPSINNITVEGYNNTRNMFCRALLQTDPDKLL
jgi:hypothetical protein